MIGMILGNRYEILKEIGSGGMANVYLAHCRLLNRNVAVKVLKNEFSNDKEFLTRFNKEAQAAAAIASPNIVNVYDVGHDGDTHYIVMEYVEGNTLKEYIDANGMLSWQETVEYAIQICSALDKAHKNGVIHRDIKPQNIILTNDGILKVTDFGIARASSNETLNMGESTMGSVHYFSPEQARGGYTDEKSDIYSLGVVMYELITGTLPFNGESPIAIAIKHMQQKPVSPKEYNVSIPLAVESIILKAMSKEQNLRYQSAEEMLYDLNRVMNQPDKDNLDIPLNDGNTIKIEPVVDISPAKKEVSDNHRPVHTDKKKSQKKKKADTGSVKKAVLMAVVTAFALLGIFVVGAMALLGGCSKEVEIPDLVGKDYQKAVEEYNDFTITIEQYVDNDEYEPGVIVSQSPKGGRKTKTNMEISVKVSRDSQSFIMSDFKNSTVEEMKNFLKHEIDEYDLTFEVVEEDSEDVEKGKITRTYPPVGSKVLKGGKNTITIYISKGGLKMPDLTGIKLKDAKELLSQMKLELGKLNPSDAKDDYVVIGQSVDPEDNVNIGDKIDLELRATNDASGSGESSSKVVTVLVPQNNDTTTIRVVQDGKVIHNQVHSKSEGSIDITVTGSGKSNIEIYYNGTFNNSLTVEL